MQYRQHPVEFTALDRYSKEGILPFAVPRTLYIVPRTDLLRSCLPCRRPTRRNVISIYWRQHRSHAVPIALSRVCIVLDRYSDEGILPSAGPATLYSWYRAGLAGTYLPCCRPSRRNMEHVSLAARGRAVYQDSIASTASAHSISIRLSNLFEL